jgi:hypothetical protein
MGCFASFDLVEHIEQAVPMPPNEEIQRHNDYFTLRRTGKEVSGARQRDFEYCMSKGISIKDCDDRYDEMLIELAFWNG